MPDLPSAGLFRFGRLTASLRTNDADFARRFGRIFHDCREHDACAATASDLSVFVSRDDDHVLAWISSHAVLDEEAARGLLPGVPISSHGNQLAVPKDAAWPIFLAHYFVHHVMSLHLDVLFLHGATVDVGGRALFLGGNKGAGKSTLALALGARGHRIFGDEVAAIGMPGLECLPFRRAVSVRDGPQAVAVHEFLERRGVESERLADGTVRRRVPISEVFPAPPPRPVRLEAAVFLRGFGSNRKIEPMDFSLSHAQWLGPLLATFANRPAGLAAIGLVQLFARLRCYSVTLAGSPDQMAECLEELAEDRCS